MKLFILMGQRKCNYPGEYAIEALDIMDEFSVDENPHYLHDKMDGLRNTGEFEALEIIPFNVDDGQIKERLFPIDKPLDATIDDG